MTLRKKIYNLFKSTGLSEEEYAPLICTSQSNFSNCIKGRRHFSKGILKQIEKYHGCILNSSKTKKQPEKKKTLVVLLTEEHSSLIKEIGELYNQLDKEVQQELNNSYLMLMQKILGYKEGAYPLY